MVGMFRRSKVSQINEFFNLPLKSGEVALYYLGVSGFIVRTTSQSAIFDPAGMLKNDEVKGAAKRQSAPFYA